MSMLGGNMLPLWWCPEAWLSGNCSHLLPHLHCRRPSLRVVQNKGEHQDLVTLGGAKSTRFLRSCM